MPEEQVNAIFLRGVWSALIPSDVDNSWVERVASLDPDDEPLGDFEIDPETEAPIRPIWGLHEEILGADPSGTEMRPPQA